MFSSWRRFSMADRNIMNEVPNAPIENRPLPGRRIHHVQPCQLQALSTLLSGRLDLKQIWGKILVSGDADYV